MPAAEKAGSPKTLGDLQERASPEHSPGGRSIASVLGAEICTPEAVPYTSLDEYDLIGFGSGIYYGRFHDALWDWLRGLSEQPVSLPKKPAFVFSTAGISLLWKLWHDPLKKELARRGFVVIGDFHCRGFDTWGPLWLTGGLNRKHPDERDLARAAEFARRLQNQFAVRQAHAGLSGQAALRAG